MEHVVGPELVSGATAILATVLASLILRYLGGAAKILYAQLRSFTFYIPFDAAQDATATLICVQSFLVQNAGRKAAGSVELIWNYRPFHFEVWPVVPYEIDVVQNGRFILRFPSMSPKENLEIELIGRGSLPDLVNVRASTAKVPKRVRFQSLRVYPQWVIGIIGLLMVLGFAAAVYALVRLVLWLT